MIPLKKYPFSLNQLLTITMSLPLLDEVALPAGDVVLGVLLTPADPGSLFVLELFPGIYRQTDK